MLVNSVLARISGIDLGELHLSDADDPVCGPGQFHCRF